ncbi:MAG: DEAD/DEAH box helicase family protein [Ruminococcus sp.]|nr:DEAD/DEAH box helicase family protein [Ruminococcus sp.]
MNYKEYNISFYGKQYKSKPSESEAAKISRNLSACRLTYDFLAHRIGECGCTFAPAVFNGARKTENFSEQQLFAIDIDEKVTFEEIKKRADRYRLPVLFAYRSFSWTAEHEKFRMVFAMNRTVTDAFTAQVIIKMLMCIFEECDSHCSDLARMYYGSNKGLLVPSETGSEFSFDDIIVALNCYMFDKYDESHYTAKIHRFYNSAGVETDGKNPVYSVENGNLIIKKSEGIQVKNAKRTCSGSKSGRRRKTKVDFETLKERCRLYRDFVEGNEWYYYPQLLRIATNMINMENGKPEFLKILDSTENEHCTSYHERSWKPILNTIIGLGYKPMSCDECPHVKDCPHYKNMICTVNSGYCGIRPLEIKKYCTVEEAEESLKENFAQAVESQNQGIKILKAQTGLGKTHTCLNYIKNSSDKFLLVVPTHRLIREIMEKAQNMGIEFCTMPELKGFSKELTDEIQHIYDVGAGIVSLKNLRNMFNNMNTAIPL